MSLTDLKPVAKAVVSAAVALVAYLVGVIPAEGGFGDVTLVQWLGAILFVAAGFGITYQVPNAELGEHDPDA